MRKKDKNMISLFLLIGLVEVVSSVNQFEEVYSCGRSMPSDNRILLISPQEQFLYDRYSGCWSIQFFRIVNPIQIQYKYVIDNPNPLFKMDWQSNPNPITIQHLLEKFQRKKNIESSLEGKYVIPKGGILFSSHLNSQTFLWKLWIKLAWLCFGQSIMKF